MTWWKFKRKASAVVTAIRYGRVLANIYARMRLKGSLWKYQYHTDYFKNGHWFSESGFRLGILKWSLRGPRLNPLLDRLMPDGKMRKG